MSKIVITIWFCSMLIILQGCHFNIVIKRKNQETNSQTLPSIQPEDPSNTRDTTAPNLTLSKTDPYISKDIATFTLSGTCSSDVSSITISGDLSYTLTCTSNTWSQDISTLSLPDNVINLTFTANDSAGNSSTPFSFQFDTRLCNMMASETSHSARGAGTALSPYLICNVNQFKDIQATGCNPTTSTSCDKSFKLMSDLDFSGHTIIPIGDQNEIIPFSGVIDGNGKVISNLNITATNYNTALIAYSDGALIKNINIQNSTFEANGQYSLAFVVASATNSSFDNIHISGSMTNSNSSVGIWDMGAIAGILLGSGSITNVSFTGNISGASYLSEVGGLFGYISGSYSANQLTYAGVISSSGEFYNVGGIAGAVYASGLTLSQLLSIGQIQCNTLPWDSCVQVGGLIGDAQNLSIDNSTSNMKILTMTTDSNFHRAGGLIGYGNSINITQSYFNGDLILPFCTMVGGIAGYVDNGTGSSGTTFNISKSYFDGRIHCTGSTSSHSTWMLGGLIGYLRGIKTNFSENYVKATIVSLANGSNNSVGCFAGYIDGGNINDNFSQCSLTLGNKGDTIGGFVGGTVQAAFSQNYTITQISHGSQFTNYGGFVGFDYAGTTYTNNFYSSTAAPNYKPTKIMLNSTTGQVEAVSAPNLVKQNTFTSKGWDFTIKWEIQEGLDYPTLRSLPIVDTYCNTNSRNTNSPFANSGELGIDGLSEATAYTICSPIQFLEIAANSIYWNKYFILKSHLNFTGITPPQDFSIGDYPTAFTGTFDGNNKTIKNYAYNDPYDEVGLFGLVHGPALIKNLRLFDIDIEGRQYIGALIGKAQGSTEVNVSNVIISGKVRARDMYASSVVSEGRIIINNVHSYAQIISPSAIGGLVGDLNSNLSLIKNSSFQGSISTTGDGLGGLVSALNSGKIEDSFATVDISTTGHQVGGLAGTAYNTTSISRSFSLGNITGGSYVGGIIGYGYSTNVSDSYAKGNISGINYVGGLIGESNSSSINRSYSSGSVITTTNDGGGLLGYSSGTNSLTYSFYVGSSITANTATNSVIGRIIGNFFAGTQSNNYYSSNSTCNNSGGGTCNSIGTSIDMNSAPNYFYNKTSNPYLNGSWDFTNVWVENLSTNSYPTLKP